MSVYFARGPEGTRFKDVKLRIHAQFLKDHPGKVKAVVQSVDPIEGVIPEDPIAVEMMDPVDFLGFISDSIREGWDIISTTPTSQWSEIFN